MTQSRTTATTRLTMLAMLSAISYAFMFLTHFLPPVVLFLKYDPKDIIITIGGFLFGPLSVVAMSVVVSSIEMLSVSDAGIIGLFMNVLSTCAFACTAAYIYKRRKTLTGAVTGLAAGVLVMTLVMLLWNYFIVPMYMGIPRAAVAELLIPAFLPFNLIKGVLNAAATMLLYKPVTGALRHSHLLPASDEARSSVNVGAVLVSALALISCVVFILIWQGAF